MVAKTHLLSLSPLYRTWQFFQALTARPLAPAELQTISVRLNPAQLALFRRMEIRDQRHSYQVMRTLQANGHECDDLLVAALLHDGGKARYPLRLWERPLVVLLRWFRPQSATRWGRNSLPQGWKRPFVIDEQHPTWGAEMAAAAGCTPLTVQLIQRHQERPGSDQSNPSWEDQLLAALRAADDAN